MTPNLILLHGDGESPTMDEQEFYLVLKDCFDKFAERNRKRHGIWRRSGLRGMTHEVFAKAERAYAQVFVADEIPDCDHYEDIINYAVFALIMLKDYESNTEKEEPRLRLLRNLYGDWPR